MKTAYQSRNLCQAGFTLVELLVVISLVGILAGVTLSIINPVKQRKIAKDGVKQSNLQKLALGIEAYGNRYFEYPAVIAINSYNIPTDDKVKAFVGIVPNDEPADAIYKYHHSVSPADEGFAITVEKSEVSGQCFKYRSAWGKIKVCPIASCNDEATTTECKVL